MILKLDSRESDELLADLIIAFDQTAVVPEKEFLETGDIVFDNIVIERKEANDFVSSIIDGRIKEQVEKMKGFPFRYIIIEGNPFETGRDLSPNCIIGKMTSLIIKHKIGLFYVNNLKQLAYCVFSIINKHLNLESQINETPVKVHLKEDHNDIVMAMILQIPGVGPVKAKDISNKYNNSLKDFVNNVSNESLEEIDGIGKILSKKIIEQIK